MKAWKVRNFFFTAPHVATAGVAEPAPANEYLPVDIEFDSPAGMGGNAGGTGKKLDNPSIEIQPLEITWNKRNLPLRRVNLREYTAMAGCLPAKASLFFTIKGKVTIRSASAEIPYTEENFRLNFPGRGFINEVDFPAHRDTRLDFLTRTPVRINSDGSFESQHNNLQLTEQHRVMILYLLLADPARKIEAPPASFTTLTLTTTPTDLSYNCENATAADQWATYYSNWYEREANKLIPLNNSGQQKSISFQAAEKERIDYYLESIGLSLDSRGTLRMVPGWQAPDYWRWACRNSIWNERQSLRIIDAALIKNRMQTYRNNYTTGRTKPLPFLVFIGELRRYEELNKSWLSPDLAIRLLRRAGHESSLIFDQVLGLPVDKDWRQYKNEELGGMLQFLKDHNRVEINQEEVDIWHLMVGLDALPRDKGPGDVVRLNFGRIEEETDMERAAAATWAGDIGSSLIDWLVRFDETVENKNGLNSPDKRLDYYWNTRSSTADLHGDIFAWGVHHLKGKVNSSRLSDILLAFFDQRVAIRNKKASFQLFVNHYSVAGKPAEIDIPRLENQIEAFGLQWNRYRLFYSGKVWQYTEGEKTWARAELVSKFINYLDKQLK